MRELVVISGKGGTGKTSLLASFAVLAESAVIADCDVDAADLHLVLEPTVRERADFSGGSQAAVYDPTCSACGLCRELCRFDAIRCIPRPGRPDRFEVDPVACEGCGVCAHFCPTGAMQFGPVVNGEWYVSDTRCGVMVHARLGIAEENSGKLVTQVRSRAKAIAKEQGADWVLVDGSPGIGCPVIASVGGADLALVVTEPTLSGRHDLHRILALTRHFGVVARVCINKWDLNPEITAQIEAEAAEAGAPVAGKIRYDSAVTQAQIQKQTVVEFSRGAVADQIKALWDTLRQTGQNGPQ
jgi:MinD superfamily P-loop ATPase